MSKLRWLAVLGLCTFLGCSSVPTLRTAVPTDADGTADAFFRDLHRGKRQDAYNLFGQGLSQRVSFDQFNQLIDAIEQKWGRIESEETVQLPFHTRTGEADFIPMHTPDNQVKRYTYEVQFGTAKIDLDLTLAPENGQYKIVWFSLWGSTIYFTQEIREKIQGLFGAPQEDNDTAPASGT